MFARVFNKYSLSFLSLAAVSAGLLSCGGSGDSGEGTCLPSGSRLNMVVPITDQVNPDNASSLIISWMAMIPTFLWRRFREPLPVLLFPPRLTWCTEGRLRKKLLWWATS